MKGFFAIFSLMAAGVAGYLAEPSLRYQLTGHRPNAVGKPVSSSGRETPPEKPATPTLPPAPAVPGGIDLSQLTPAQLPTQVVLKVSTEVADASGLKMKVDPGNRLRLIRIEGDMVVVSPGSSPFEGRVPVAGTDLMEQLAANPPATVPTVPPVVPQAEPTPPAPVTPVPPVTPVEPVAPPVDPVAPAAVTPAPEPSVTPAPAPTPPPVPAVDVVAIMKKHIAEGNIKDFAFNQVQEWKAGPDEVIDGETFQVGLARYHAETILGNKLIDAKALIKNGSVVRWISPKSNMEIK